MSLRQEFVHLASQESMNMRALCRRYGISAKTGYKWLASRGVLTMSGFEGLGRNAVRLRIPPTIANLLRFLQQVEAELLA